MIIKSFELEKLKSNKSNLHLIFGNNEGIKEDIINIVIQINGKKRAMIEVKTNEKEEKIIKECLQITNVKKFIDDKVILKKIYIKNKLVNLVVK